MSDIAEKIIEEANKQLAIQITNALTEILDEFMPEKEDAYISFSSIERGFYVSTTSNDAFNGNISLSYFEESILESFNEEEGLDQDDLNQLAKFFSELSLKINSKLLNAELRRAADEL